MEREVTHAHAFKEKKFDICHWKGIRFFKSESDLGVLKKEKNICQQCQGAFVNINYFRLSFSDLKENLLLSSESFNNIFLGVLCEIILTNHVS